MIVVQQNDKSNEAFLLQQQGKYLEAIQYAHAQLLKAKMNDSVRDMLDAYVDLYYCYFNELLLDEAIHVYEAHKQLYATTNNPADTMYHYVMSYMLYDMTKQYDLGIETLQKAIAIATSLQQHNIIGLANCFIGALYTRKKQYNEAIQYASLGVAYMRTFVPKSPLMHIQGDVCLAQIFISANAFEDVAPMITALEQMEDLQKHQTIYFQFLFIKLRYLYATHQIEEARKFRPVLLEAIDTTSDYVIAKMLLPILKQTLTELQLHDELTFWIQYEHSLQSLLTHETTSILQAFSMQQHTMLHEPTQQTLLTKSQFFTEAHDVFQAATHPLILVLFQLNDATLYEKNRSYFQFHVMQQVMNQLTEQFSIQPRLRCYFSHHKFALLFEHDQLEDVLCTLNQLQRRVRIKLLQKELDVDVSIAHTSTITSRSNSFLEMYHLVESRLYHIVFH